jgi:hypothetical protein
MLATAAPASAAPGDPVVSFISMGGFPQTAAALASSTVDGTAPTTALAPGINAHAYAVSDDGNTLAISGWTGAYNASDADVTYGTVVVRRVGSTVETRLLSSQFLANPVVSPDGLSVWFLNRVFAPGALTSTLGLYKYNVTSKAVTKLALAASFQPATATGAAPVQLAVSPDGLNAAITYESFDNSGKVVNPSRILAGGISTGKSSGNWFEVAKASAATDVIGTSTLNWGSDSTTLTYSTFASASGDLTNHVVNVTTSNASASGTTLAGWYDVARFNNEWWMWQDATGPVTNFGHSTDPSPVVAPGSTSLWTGNYFSRSFKLSAATPPVAGVPVTKPTAHPDLILNLPSVGYKKTTQYVSYNDYMIPIPGQTFADNYSETQQGVLESSTDGKVFTFLRNTSGARPVTASGYTWTGILPAVTRTTYYRWRFPGTLFAAAGVSPVSKLTMIPTVTATVKKVGSKRVISGTATRVRGSVTLYKVVGSKATKVSTKPLSAKGIYTFGTLTLAAGTYRVSTVADGYAGVGSKTFKI